MVISLTVQALKTSLSIAIWFKGLLYHLPGSSTTLFLEEGSDFLSSVGSNFIICSDINVHLDVECGDITESSRFNNILQCCNFKRLLAQLIY